ncbi:hypothetical protein FS842_011036 [Serendipita sp. 407]|nr:hypothetical protein FS842_011036 [Serendipita sp. 407]
MQPIQSLRSRVGSVFRRGSMSNKENKDDQQSGNESSRPPSPSPRKSSVGAGETGSMRLKRKRLSLSFRGRSGTNDTLEHSQLAQQVVADIEAKKVQEEGEDKPTVEEQVAPAVAASGDANTDVTKIDESPVEPKMTDKVQDDCKHEEEATPAVPVPVEEPVVEQVITFPEPVQALAPEPVEETPIITHEVHAPEPSMWGAHSRVGGLEESYHVIMKEDSPNQSTTNVAVVDTAPSFPEPAPYETSYSSSASGVSPDVSYTSPTSLLMPVPNSTGHRQPLSAIDENSAKVHPLAEQFQQSQPKEKQRAAEETTVQQPPKEDVNYDADEEESKPLLDSSILTGMDNSLTMQPPYDIDSNNNNNDSLLSLRTSPIDLKGKGREQEQPRSASSTLFESLGWTEYILPDTSYYFALHVSSPASPQHLRMPSPIFISPPPPQPPTVTVVADYDLRNQQILKRVCEEMRTLIKMELPAGSSSDRASGWELWLHRPLGYIPSHLDTTRPPIVHTWVNHTRRLLAPRPLGTVELPPREDGDVVTLVNGYGKSSTTSVGVAGPSNGQVVETDRERLSKELAYWAFVERHPAHGILNETARREALEGLTAVVCWGIPYLFLESPADSNSWSRFQPLDGNAQMLHPARGIYFSESHKDLEAEKRTSAMIYGAGVGVTAAVVIGSATTLLTMRPPLDSPARTASFVALICAGASLAASLISLARLTRVSRTGGTTADSSSYYSTYPPSAELFFPGVKRDTESQIVLNTKTIRRALSLVLLAYSIVSLLVAVLLHNFAPKGRH